MTRKLRLVCGLGTSFAMLAGARVLAQPEVSLKSADPYSTDLRVMSLNIRYGTAADGDNRWEKRRELVFDVLRDHKPDLVGLQESLKWQIDELLAACPQYGYVGVGRKDGREAGEYAAILYDKQRFKVEEQSTFWFSDTPETSGSKHWGNRVTRVCTWARLVERPSGRSFYIYNVHLDHQSAPSRERSVALLADRIGRRRHEDPVIVTGDFNTGEQSAVIRFTIGEQAEMRLSDEETAPSPKLVDTFRALHPDAQNVGTFNAFEGARTGPKIDFVFASLGVKVLEAGIIHDHHDGRYPSDHFPVFARVKLPSSDWPNENR